MINKKVIKISERNWLKLKSLELGSMDKTLNNVMDTVEGVMPFVEYSDDTMKSVNIYEDTFKRLNSFRLSDTEAKETIVTRLLIEYNKKNKISVEIPIRLTSPLNKKLIMHCFVTPSEVMCMTENSSLEFKAWEKLLNWNEIHELALSHADERISINKPNYRIDINYS